ncbi:hypothetical protein BH23PLA1_BH23PLA1_37000 [soil metagenome]
MLHILISNKSGRTPFDHGHGPLELGRGPRRDVQRRVIDDLFLSTNQLRLEERPEGRVWLENLSGQVPISVTGGADLGPGQHREVALPVRLTVGQSIIDIELARLDEPTVLATLRSIDRPVQGAVGATLAPLSSLGEAPDAQQLARWLEALVAVQRSAAASPDFYAEAARAVVELIGLDCGSVLLRRGDDWEVVARHGNDPGAGAEFSRTILGCLCEDRSTFYQVLDDHSATRSQLGGSAVVAAPILDADGERAIGAIYGLRDPQGGAACAAIRPLEAQLVQVVAATVGAGLARITSEAEAARRHRQFTDFFSPELAQELDRRPDLLEGEEREITVLFSDIRGFSRISERLSPADTCRLVRDVMEQLTRRIREHQGVVVDYIGDAILALWNAPADQPDHATLACRAVLAMLEELPALNDRWAEKIGGPFGLGIGLNTGPALVGNTGSQSRFKYGPLGHTVNLASRVEGATKYLGVPALITGATHAALGEGHPFATRRLCQVEVVGIKEPVHLFELHAATLDAGWRGRRDTYEAGLRSFEDGKWAEACQRLYPLLRGQEGQYDLPSLTLIGRAIEHLKDPLRPFNPVLKLESK